MAAHNSARTIGQAIESVRLQTHDQWELIVVDDGSNDATAEIASSFADERIRVIQQERHGPAAARNAGITQASAQFVSTLDSDDMWLPDYLKVMTEALAGDPEAIFAYTDAWVLEDKSGRVRKTSEMAYQDAPDPSPRAARALFAQLLERNFVYNSVTVRRRALELWGGYDERLATCEDWELWLRLTANGCRGIRAPGILAVHRDHAGSLSTDPALMRTSRNQVFEIIESGWDIDDEARALARTVRLERIRRRPRDFQPSSKPGRPRALWRLIRRRTMWRADPPAQVASLLDSVGRV